MAAGQVEKYLSRESLGTMLCRGHVLTHLACTQLSAESHIKKWNQVWGKKLNGSQDENVLNLVGATNICSHGNLRPEPAV